jgi:hypothetical protein
MRALCLAIAGGFSWNLLCVFRGQPHEHQNTARARPSCRAARPNPLESAWNFVEGL